jgi:putative methylase
MKKKELEMMLQNVPIYERPNPFIEQYMTPADIAADIIFTACQFGDVQNKIVVDLGCGTGIFSVGASIVGAKEIIGIDIDSKSIEIAKKYAEENDFEISYMVQNVNDFQIECDTVIMNPPFGAQKSNQKADRRFIEKGFEIASVIYSLHLTDTVLFIEKMIASLNGEIDFYKDYKFPVKHTFSFHDKKVVEFNVTLLRILTKR